jgi:hypothetical protein
MSTLLAIGDNIEMVDFDDILDDVFLYENKLINSNQKYYHLIHNDKCENKSCLTCIYGLDKLKKLFIVQKNSSSRFYQLFNNVNEFENYIKKIPKEDKSYFENIWGDQPQKLRFDIDFNDKYKKFSPKFKETVYDNLIHSIINTFEELYNICLEANDIFIFNGSKKEYNRHIIINKYYVCDNTQARHFYNKVISKLNENEIYYNESGKTKYIIDPSIYKSTQLLKICENSKFNSNNYKQQISWFFNNEEIKQNYNFKESLITYTQNCELLPEIVILKPIYNKIIPNNYIYNHDLKMMDILINLCVIETHICDHEDWKSLIGIFYGLFGYIDEVVKYIYDLSSQYYEKASLDEHERIFSFYEYNWDKKDFHQPNEGIIWNWIKKDNINAFNELQKIQKNKIIYSDIFTEKELKIMYKEFKVNEIEALYFNNWNDFTNIIHKDTFQIDRWLAECINFISHGGNSFYITKNLNDDDQLEYEYVKKINLTIKKTIELINPDYDENSNIKQSPTIKIPILSYIETNFSNVYSYTKFLPYTIHKIELRKDIFNLFSGFKSKIIKKEIDESKFENILYHIKYSWCNGNEIYYDYIIKWFASILQKPNQKSKVALLLRAKKQQTGKQLIVNFIGDYIIGSKHFTTVKEVKQVTERFNKTIENKILTVMDEVCWGGDIKTNNSLKNLITQPKQQIELKGYDAMELDDYNNYVYCTNEDWPLKIEKGDNRIFPLEINCNYQGNFKYFNKISDEFNDKTAKHLYNWFLRIDLSDFKTQKIPETELKKELIFYSLSLFDKFLIDLRDNYINSIKDNVLYQTNILNDIFKNWCSSKKIKNSDTDRQFALKIKNIGFKEKRKDNKRYILMDFQIINNYVDNFYKNDIDTLEEITEEEENKINNKANINEFDEI